MLSIPQTTKLCPTVHPLRGIIRHKGWLNSPIVESTIRNVIIYYNLLICDFFACAKKSIVIIFTMLIELVSK
jgi:hypothetical protein